MKRRFLHRATAGRRRPRQVFAAQGRYSLPIERPREISLSLCWSKFDA
ncbi:MAG: hypothetical protein NC203_04870 [Firmicutes bacterium]|nr:hypothetical protein [[Eubacterium] siraeum]MCM1487682.1 hypothetical protein [Bacillota bacterium]